MADVIWTESSHGQQPDRFSPHADLEHIWTSPMPVDWTRYVAERSYILLAEQGLFPIMSINYPPTLQRELARVERQYAGTDPELSERTRTTMDQMAVALRNGGIASTAIHRILPFDTPAQKRVTIGAGIRNFVELTGEYPLAFWSAEGGMDIATLAILAAPPEDGGFGIRAFICAPEQLYGSTQPCRIALPNGHSIIAVPFGTIGRELAFDTDRRVNADWFAARVIRPLIDDLRRGNAWWKVLFPWKDLETWGGHDPQKASDPRAPGSELFAAHLLKRTLPDMGVELKPFKQVILELLADPERIPIGQFRDWSAWSCSNGLVRWDGTGHCDYSGGAEWKQPFYLAHRYLTDAVMNCVMEELDYHGPEGEAQFATLMQTRFHEAFTNRGGKQSDRKLSLFSAAATALGAGGSCGTFYDTLDTSGWINIVFARTAVEHLRDAGMGKQAGRIWAMYTSMMSYVPAEQLACPPEDQSPVPLAPHLLGQTAARGYR